MSERSARGKTPGAHDSGSRAAANLTWERATDFCELLLLARRFLSGEISSFPGWRSAELDEETDALLEVLSSLNRVGFLSVASQPGSPFGPGHDGRVWGGRAFVGGFAPTDLARRLEEHSAASGLVALASGSGEDRIDSSGDCSFPAGLRDGIPYLVLGNTAREAEIEIFRAEASPAAAEVLAGLTFLWIVDPVWGRRERLPRALSDVSFGTNAEGSSP